MAFSNGPSTITNGLVLALDAADKNSYAGSGTTWRDLSGRGNNGTLTNGPTFSSANQGTIVFDGIDDYVNCGNNSSLSLGTMTISAWVKPSTNISNYRAIIADESVGGAPWNYRLFLNISAGTVIYDIHDGTAYSGLTSTYAINDNNWHYVCGVRVSVGGAIRLYIDGALNASATDTTNRSTLANAVWVGISPVAGGGYPFLGSIAKVQVYNTALSTEQILQNYNAQKSRFNL